jgi:AbiV family abortive infection protein
MRTKARRDQGARRCPPSGESRLRLYYACLENARGLLGDAELLLEKGSAPRAFALAFTAYEEIGKSQVVADFFNDQVAESEFASAFRLHHLKLAYLERIVRLSAGPLPEGTIDYDIRKLNPLTARRNDGLYVSYVEGYEPRRPAEALTADQAREMIDAAQQELESIDWAEELNGRIGSKGLFK